MNKSCCAGSCLAVRNLCFSHGICPILNGVNLTVDCGCILGLVGDSGCGKTTLLRLIAGLESPIKGSILLNGQEVSSPHCSVPPESRGVGLMFQDYALFPHLTVKQNVLFGLHKLPSKAATARTQHILSQVHLLDRQNDYPGVLSGGEQQRVALSRAIAPSPQILLMDEPFSNLDRGLRDTVLEQTRIFLRNMQATAIIVSHDPEEIMRLSDIIAFMSKGRIEQCGTAEALYSSPHSLTVMRFFERGNEIPGRAQKGFIETPLGSFPSSHSYNEGQKVVVCIRAHHISLCDEENSASQIESPTERFQGHIVERRFFGNHHILHVMIPQLEIPLILRIPAHKDIYSAPLASFSITKHKAHIFPI